MAVPALRPGTYHGSPKLTPRQSVHKRIERISGKFQAAANQVKI